LDRLVAIKDWGIGAEALHEPKGLKLEFGIVRARGDAGGFGARVDQNPLQNLMVLYGTGHLRLNDTTGRNQPWAVFATPSRTASSTTRNSSSPTWRPWSRRRNAATSQ
jgi:hypothetical protein